MALPAVLAPAPALVRHRPPWESLFARRRASNASFSMKAKDVMSRHVVTIDKDDRLEAAMERMRKERMSKLVVLEKGRLAGILSMGDIADELGAIKNRGVPTSHLHASSAMRRRVPTCTPETPLAEVVRTMQEEDLPLLPVVHDATCVGVVTASDLLRRVDGASQLATVMTETVHVVAPTDRVIHARRLMVDHHVERVPVLDGGKLVGILGETDVAWGLANFKDTVKDKHQSASLQRFLVEDIFQRRVVTARPEETLADGAKRMVGEDVGCLPVLRGDRLVGIVSRSDLVPHARIGAA
jgi:CBS domain-containing protein